MTVLDTSVTSSSSLHLLSNRPLPLVLASCGEPSIMRYSVLVPCFSSRRPVSCFSYLVPRFQFLVFSYSFSVTRLSISCSSFLVLGSITFFSSITFVRWLLLVSLSSLPRHLDVHLLLISGWVHLSRTHAGFRWCASSIGSVSTVLLLPCRQVLALIVPSRLGFISSGRWR